MFNKVSTSNYSDGTTVEQHAADFIVTLAGDGLWGARKNTRVHVTGATVVRREGAVEHVSVQHNSAWELYTDSAFSTAVSNALGYTVGFTEQGMQADGRASLEC